MENKYSTIRLRRTTMNVLKGLGNMDDDYDSLLEKLFKIAKIDVEKVIEDKKNKKVITIDAYRAKDDEK